MHLHTLVAKLAVELNTNISLRHGNCRTYKVYADSAKLCALISHVYYRLNEIAATIRLRHRATCDAAHLTYAGNLYIYTTT